MQNLTPHVIDLNAYPRRAHFDYFRSLANLYVGVTMNADVSRLAAYRRETGAPFFLTLLYFVSRAANAVPELRQRIRGDELIEYPFCPTSHTVARADGTYAYCTLSAYLPLVEFLPLAQETQARSRNYGGIDEDDDVLACLFVSCLPWLSYTALVQPTPIPADSNPRITWGRAFKQDGCSLLPLSLLCNHALVDGLHLSRFYEALDAELSKL